MSLIQFKSLKCVLWELWHYFNTSSHNSYKKLLIYLTAKCTALNNNTHLLLSQFKVIYKYWKKFLIRFECACDYPWSGEICERYDSDNIVQAVTGPRLSLIYVYLALFITFNFACMLLTLLRRREISKGEISYIGCFLFTAIYLYLYVCECIIYMQVKELWCSDLVQWPGAVT